MLGPDLEAGRPFAYLDEIPVCFLFFSLWEYSIASRPEDTDEQRQGERRKREKKQRQQQQQHERNKKYQTEKMYRQTGNCRLYIYIYLFVYSFICSHQIE